MIACVRNLVRVWLLFMVVWNVGCSCGAGRAPDPVDPVDTTTTTTTSTGEELPCGVDCATIATPECMIAVCNTGQEIGPLNTCVVVPMPKGTACDDGKFCTINDACDSGTCVGGGQTKCGLDSNPCVAVVCYEESQSCSATPVNDGTSCTPTNLCKVNGVCKLGECVGEPKDCSFAPISECNKVGCDEATGKCVGVPDATKDNLPCVLTGNLCMEDRKCNNGQCAGGTPKDCSAMTKGCRIGVCDADSGACDAAPAAMGTVCTEGLNECDVGACDDKGVCIPSEAPDGAACNDHNSCTKSDECSSGACGGSPVGDCVNYLHESFEQCPAGWTLGGDWQCGQPKNVGPADAHTGKNVIATQITAVYHVGQTFETAVADSPTIDLTQATNPVLSFWAWDHTEGGTFDGWNLRVSTDGGQSFNIVTTVSPAYNLTILGKQAWGGNHSGEGWKIYTADLTAYAGQQIILRFAFRSDGATVYPGVYIDDVVVAEPLQSPLHITTETLPNVYVDTTYSVQLERVGGSPAAVWSINDGAGNNDDWLVMLDPVAGVLSGVPTAADAGPVTVSIRVQEPGLQSNFADKVFTFNVEEASYYTSFEGTCPDGWTLTGDWQCGAPSMVGPATAYVGTQCIATQIAGEYTDMQTFTGTTATSPDIDLTGVIDPKLSFRMWVDTEGGNYDGFHLLVSSDGGMNYSILDTVNPAYDLTIGGKPAWGGHDALAGWQLVQADLSAYAGMIIRLQFAFQSDSSGTSPGVYIDDILIN